VGQNVGGETAARRLREIGGREQRGLHFRADFMHDEDHRAGAHADVPCLYALDEGGDVDIAESVGAVLRVRTEYVRRFHRCKPAERARRRPCLVHYVSIERSHAFTFAVRWTVSAARLRVPIALRARLSSR